MCARTVLALYAFLGIAQSAMPRFALAESWITITSCDSVRINNTEYSHFAFSVHNFDLHYAIQGITMQPEPHHAPGDTCHMVQAAAPPGWSWTTRADGGPDWFVYTDEGEPWINPGEAKAGFEVTLSRPACCFLVGYFSATIEPFASSHECFEQCSMPTPARPYSWGHLKTQYR